MSYENIRNIVRQMSDAKLSRWDVRCFIAIGSLTVDAEDRTLLSLILRAALGIKGPGVGLTFVPHLGENAIINIRREVWSRYTDERKDAPAMVCTVDELNHALGWLLEAIEATEQEYKAIVGVVNAWISRDDTQLGVHVERQRANLEQPTVIPEDVLKDVADADAKKAERDKKKPRG